MDKDVERKANRLCERYAMAQAQVQLQRPLRLPARRQQRQAEQAAAEALGELGKGRKARCVALVRLAYVRALRQVSPGATLNEDQEREVRYLARRLTRELVRAEMDTYREFRRHMKLLTIANSMRVMGNSDTVAQSLERRTRPVPLEQRARASVGSVLELASVAGNLAGTSSDSYDAQA